MLNDNGQADLAVKQLQSPKEAERQAAKETLIQLGSSAIPPLVKVLKDLVANQNRSYVIPDEDEEAEIQSRLQPDVYELLGRLHAEEAVPLLIKAMEERQPYKLSEYCDLDMRALVEIGPAAVPRLIESMEEAETTAEQNEHEGLQVTALMIKLRAGMVLGDIGDVRALPILEKLEKETKIVDFWYAIQEVKKKNGMKYRHWPTEDDPRPRCELR